MARLLIIAIFFSIGLADSLQCCFAEEPVFVAVGYGGRRMISQDGLQWEITEEWEVGGGDNSNNLMSAVYAQGKYYVTGGGGGGKSSAGHLLVSSNGREWEEILTTRARINPILHGNNRFLAGVSGYPAGHFLVSEDGVTWSQGGQLKDKRCTHFRKGAYGNGRYVVTGNHGGNTPSWICVTEDGNKILHEGFEIGNIRDITFHDSVFVIVGEGTRHVSSDGIQWKATSVSNESKLTWVIHDGKQFLCGGSREVYSSSNGIDWKQEDLRMRGRPLWTDGNRMIATGWPGKMYLSEDGGQSWKNGNPLTPNGINQIISNQDSK